MPGIDRRHFIRVGSTAAAGWVCAPYLLLKSRYAADVIIRNGQLFETTADVVTVRDLAIREGRIASIARRVGDRAPLEIDARDLIVSPGFVDIHSHGDGSLWDDPRAESLIRQGITTIVVGQDGGSRAPRDADDASDERSQFASFTDMWASIDALKPAVNVASMIGLGAVRAMVIGGDNRPATSAEVERMTTLVREAVEQGACGASSGLEYTPGAFASREELIAVCAPLAHARLPYATHMRNEDDRLLDSIEESIAIARGSGAPLHIAHLKTQGPRNWKRLDEAFALIERARQAGVDVTFDRYPYVAYQTGLSNLFPVWSRDGSTQAFLARLDDSTVAPRIRTETLAKVELIGGWDNVQIAAVNNPDDKPAEGQRLGAFAGTRGVDPYLLATDLLKRNRGNVGMVGFAMSEENLARILAHPRGMVASDGGSFAIEGAARRGHPHPRSLGTFPRVLKRYAGDGKAMTLPAALRKMTAMPAARVRLDDRGRLAVGAPADIVVFDRNGVEDRATFAEPYQYPVGIKAVMVNGAVALLDGQRQESRSGVSLRPRRGG